MLRFLLQMVNSSNHQNGTQNETSFHWLSSSECIAWLTVFMTESVAIVTLNTVTIIVFIKARGLRKRSMYLVISLAVADMFLGGYVEVIAFFETGDRCNFWQYNLPDLGLWDSVIHVCVSLYNKPHCYFFGTVARHVSSIQASPHQKAGVWSNCCGHLGYSCDNMHHISSPLDTGPWKRTSRLLICIPPSFRVYKIFKIVRALSLVDRCV